MDQAHQRRLAAIRGGIFSVSNQEEVLDLLLALLARRTIGFELTEAADVTERG